MIRGVIFDVDGVLLNSMPVWENLGELYLQSLGIEAEKDLGTRLYTMSLEESAEFPHEIGVFLDYPLEDVQGFMANGGAGAVCQGCWKAYGDAQEAYRRFRLYGKCREVYLSCYRRGFDVLRLTVAA